MSQLLSVEYENIHFLLAVFCFKLLVIFCFAGGGDRQRRSYVLFCCVLCLMCSLLIVVMVQKMCSVSNIKLFLSRKLKLSIETRLSFLRVSCLLKET